MCVRVRGLTMPYKEETIPRKSHNCKIKNSYRYLQRPNKSNVDKFLTTFGVTTERFEVTKTDHDMWDITHIATYVAIQYSLQVRPYLTIHRGLLTPSYGTIWASDANYPLQ